MLPVPSSRLTIVALGVAALLLFAAEELVRTMSPGIFAVPPYIVGLALLAWATRGVTPRGPEASPAVAAQGRRARMAAIALLSFSVLTLAVSSTLVILDARRAPSAYFDRAMVLMVAGMAAGIVGFSLWAGVSRAGVSRWLRANWREVALVAAVVAFGAFLRLYRIGEYPPPGGIAQDEGLTGASASLIAHDPAFRSQPIHPISYYYIAGYAAVLFGDDVLTFRLVHVAAGVALLPAFYLLARALLGAWPALAMTFLLAVERWYVNASRLMYNWMHVSLFEVLAVLGLIMGLRTRKAAYFALAGWALSEGLKGYVTFRVVIIAVVLYLMWLAIADRRALKGNLLNLGVFALTFGVFAAPYIANVIREPYWFFERHVVIQNVVADAAGRGLTVPGLLWQNALGTLSLLTQRGERWAVENLPNTPLLDPVTAALSMAGAGYALVRWRREGNVLLLLLIGGTLIGGGVLAQDPVGRRIFGVFPVLLLVSGQALRDAGHALAGVAWRPQLVHAASAALLGVMLVAAAVSGIYTFFWGQSRNPITLTEFLGPRVATANAVRALPGRPYVYLMSDLEWFHPIQDYTWLAGRPEGRKVQDLRDLAPGRDAPGRDVAFVIATPYNTQALLAELQRLYPGGTATWYEAPYPTVRRYTVVSYHLPARTLADSQGLLAVYQEGVAPPQPSARPDATLALGWGDGGPPPTLRFARWAGALYAPVSGAYTFTQPGNHTLVVAIDGVETLAALKTRTVIPLARGWHRLEAVATLDPARPPPILSWRKPDGVEETMPAAFLRPVEGPGGLLGTYESDKQSFQAIDPVVSAFWAPHPLPTPYRVRWQGALVAPQAGEYRLELTLLGGTARLCVDGKEIIQGQASRDLPGRTFNAPPLSLDAGRHMVELAFVWRDSEVSAVELRWTPPGSQMQVIPSTALHPVAPGGPVTGSACPPLG